MKKFFVTILTFIYLVTTTGATLHTHYCMGKVFSVDFVKKDGCTKCGMQTSEDCCKDELKVIKVNDNHQQAINEISSAPAFAIVEKQYTIAADTLSSTTLASAIYNNSPPNSSGTSLCVLYCVFRI
ncbi:HYC_CC_PP family protein [Segetibacter aerophilus]|uniref:HYC_CC_PP family protein n=1 Tax=Segetibacter aerophilus TaxID=670293 RepID=UPI0011BFC3DA|nr:hypothetical protein [Segetibacter aerophilus]